MKRETGSVLMQTEQVLQTAKVGLEILRKYPIEKRLCGLRNLVTFGRCVTTCLQGLRHIEPDFDNWYNKYVVEMKNDPLLYYFYQLRNDILKKGELQLNKTIHIGHFDSAELMKLPKPKGANSFFLGDEIGGSGWNITLEDGTTEKFYVQMNDSIIVEFNFPNSPKIHLGNMLGSSDVTELSILYIDYLTNMVKNAKIKFNPVNQQ